MIKIKTNAVFFFVNPLCKSVYFLNINFKPLTLQFKHFFFFKTIWNFLKFFKKCQNIKVNNRKINSYRRLIFAQIHLKTNYLCLVNRINYCNDGGNLNHFFKKPNCWFFFLQNFLTLQLVIYKFFFKAFFFFDFFFKFFNYFNFMLYLNKPVRNTNYDKLFKKQFIYSSQSMLSLNTKFI